MGAQSGNGLTIIMGRNGVRYSDPDDWERLIREERLKRGDVVPTRRGDDTLVRLPADEVPELRALFDKVEGVRPAPPEAPPPAPQTPVPAPAPAPEVTAPMTTPIAVKPSRSRRAPAPPPPEPTREPEPVVASAAAAPPWPQVVPPQPPVKRLGEKKAFPTWARALTAVLALLFLAYIVGGSPDTSTDTGTEAVAGEAATVYVTRETRIRPAPRGTGNTPVANIGRGEKLDGVWETGADGRTPWLRITEGRYAGNYVWGPNLSDIEPPDLASTMELDLELIQAAALRAQPDAGAVALQQLEPGTRVRVVGQLASGWYELSRTSGGVGYVPEEAFEADDASDALPEAPVLAESDPLITEEPASEIIDDPVVRGPAPAVARAEPQPAPAAPPPPYVSQPSWVDTPSPSQMAGVMPSRALDTGTSGRAVMDCGVGGDGRLQDCRVTEEQPDGYGFGGAALSLARLFRMEATDNAGDPVAGRRVRIPTRYAVD